MKTTVRQITDENMFSFDFEEYYDYDFSNNNIVITGNRRFNSFGNEDYINIINNDYYDDELGYDYEPLEFLQKITNKKWNCKTINGYSQGEWNKIYYVEDEISNEYIKQIADFYFGKFDVFQIEEDDEIYTEYISHDTVWKGKKAICEALGLEPDNTIVLMEDGYTKVYKYKELN